CVLLSTESDLLGLWLGKLGPAEEPRAVGQGMIALDYSCLAGDPQDLRRYVEQTRCVGQVERRLDAVKCRVVHRGLVMRAQGGDALTCPPIAMAGQQAVSIEDAGNQVIGGDEREVANRGYDLGSGAVALSSAPLGQTKLGMYAADPVGQQNDLGGLIIEIGNNFVDDGTDDTLLQSGIRRGCGPDRPKVLAERGGVEHRQGGRFEHCGI